MIALAALLSCIRGCVRRNSVSRRRFQSSWTRLCYEACS
jgi:hypothetical protein